MLNPILIKKQNLNDDDIKELQKCHHQMNNIIQQLDSLNPAVEYNDAKQLVYKIQELEFKMQKLWGFEQNENYHTHWNRPKHCSCPKLDNIDRYGTGKIINGDCILHNQ
jgi:hypothetical protein